MPKLREILDGLAKFSDPCIDWIELARDLREPLSCDPPAVEGLFRWAQKEDLLALAAMQGFVKEIEFMEDSLQRGDKCLLLDQAGRIGAFAWVTFRDYRLDFFHTLRLADGFAYLVYIHVEPDLRRRGVGSSLLHRLMQWLREAGCCQLIAGMYGDWEISIRFHLKAGFRICRKYTQRRILRFFPYPPKVEQIDE